MINRYYFTIADIVNHDLGVISPYNPEFAKESDCYWSQIYNPTGEGSVFTGDIDVKPEAWKLLRDHVWPKFYDAAVGFVDKEVNCYEEPEMPTYEEIVNSPSSKHFQGQVLGWLLDTIPTKITLIQLYEQQKDKLMSQVKSVITNTGGSSTTNSIMPGITNTITTKETNIDNDTPQVSTGLDSDSYATSLSKNNSEVTSKNTGMDQTIADVTNDNTMTTTSDKETVIKRLDEINRKLTNIYTEWSNEFRKFVLYV